MKKTFVVSVALAVVLMGSWAWAGHHEGEFDKVAEAWASAYNAGDAAAVAAMYAEDGIRLPPDMPSAEGREAIQSQVQGDMDQGLVKVKIKMVESKVMGEMGFARGVFEGFGADGSSLGMGKWANSAQYVDGKWHIRYDIWNRDAPMPAPE